MASIKFSALVSDARGKIGGNVFARNKGGAYVRSFTMPTNPQTGKQQIVRQNLASLSADWRVLSPSQRLGWNEAAQDFPQLNRMGEQYFLSGQQLFLKFNAMLAGAGQSKVVNPPNPVELPTITFFVDTVSTTALEIDATGSLATSSEIVIVRATRPVSQGRSNQFRSDFKFVAAYAGDAFDGTIALTSAYESNVATLAGQGGKKIFVEAFVVVINSGQSGVPISDNAIVTV